MINSNFANRSIDVFLEESRLVRQAKSGDTNAFVQLYETSVEQVYRYVHFMVPNNRVAEGLTFQVFFKAWEQLDHYQIFGSSFVLWLYSVAQNQVGAYYRTHKKTVEPESDFVLAARGGDFGEEYQAIRKGLQDLTAEQQQILVLKFIIGMVNKNISRVMARRDGDVRVLQMHAIQILSAQLNKTDLKSNIRGFQRILEECLMKLSSGVSTLDECLSRYHEYATQLKPLLETALLLNLGRDVKPSLTFNAYTRTALVQYVRTHPRQPQISMPMFPRTALTLSMLVVTLLATGTVRAQSALPGDALYGWKRASEQVLRVISFDSVAANIVITKHRLSELLAVVDDPELSASAMVSYLEALAQLDESTSDVDSLTVIVPALQEQQQTLSDAGLSVPDLDDYIVVAVALIPVETPVPATATQIFPTATEIPPTATDIPATATDIPPTATEIPPTETEIPPTATATEIPPTETEIPPTATEVPPTETEIPPTATATEIPPTETEIPPTPTEGTP